MHADSRFGHILNPAPGTCLTLPPDVIVYRRCFTVDMVRSQFGRHRPTLSSSATSFNKCFLWELSMTLCLAYKTKSSDQSSDTIRDAKLCSCFLRWDPSDICTKTRTSCLNQMHQNERSVTSFVLLTDSSSWTMSERDCSFYLLSE